MYLKHLEWLMQSTSVMTSLFSLAAMPLAVRFPDNNLWVLYIVVILLYDLDSMFYLLVIK